MRTMYKFPTSSTSGKKSIFQHFFLPLMSAGARAAAQVI